MRRAPARRPARQATTACASCTYSTERGAGRWPSCTASHVVSRQAATCNQLFIATASAAANVWPCRKYSPLMPTKRNRRPGTLLAQRLPDQRPDRLYRSLPNGGCHGCSVVHTLASCLGCCLRRRSGGSTQRCAGRIVPADTTAAFASGVGTTTAGTARAQRVAEPAGGDRTATPWRIPTAWQRPVTPATQHAGAGGTVAGGPGSEPGTVALRQPAGRCPGALPSPGRARQGRHPAPSPRSAAQPLIYTQSTR